MFRTSNLPELLAPAGDLECLYAAVAGGADAVYVGGKRFGARAFAKNFEMDELSRAVSYCHLHGVKLYVTLNTLIEDKEMPSAVEYAAELYRIGVDALIIADLGAISAIHRCVPDFELHASTQMSVHNTLGAEEAARLGVTRVVVARELSLENIKSVVDNSSVEIEAFLHGALCVCHSGQCLFSSMVGGRSGNRGECAQPCRLPYNGGKYILSLKDLSLANHISALIDSGVASLKIEGRMKSPDYVYTVTSIYRRLLDERRSADKMENDFLRRAFSRGGFTDGYFVSKIEGDMTGIRSEEDKQRTKEIEHTRFEPIRHSVKAVASFKLGVPAELTLTDGKKSVTVFGDKPAPAENSPLTKEALRIRLSKMGNTFLSLVAEDIEISLDDRVNLPPSAINALRRSAAEAFESCHRQLVKTEYSPVKNGLSKKKLTTASFFSERCYLDALSFDKDALLSIDIAFLPLFSGDDALLSSRAVHLPSVITDLELDSVKKQLDVAKSLGVNYALVENIGQIGLVKEYGMTPVGDFRLNVTNGESAEAYRKIGVDHLILSPELTLPKARDVGGGIITYGRIPLMITERCFIKENFGCKSCGTACLTDRKGEKFPIIKEFGHRNIIFNSLPTYMGDRQKELLEYKLPSHHLIFSIESGSDAVKIIRKHISGSELSMNVRRVGRR